MLFEALSILFPEHCAACGKTLLRKEDCLCTHCLHYLPRTGFHLSPTTENPLNKTFAGRVMLENALAMYSFAKGNKIQHLLHQLKYKNRPEIGQFIGYLYGLELKKTNMLGNVDAIVTVPLHPEKERKRGYNQSACFAEGLASALALPFHKNILKRTRDNTSQTRRHRYERWENSEDLFVLDTLHEEVQGKHLLLADDVITTGATIEACAGALLQVPGVRVTAVAIAAATH